SSTRLYLFPQRAARLSQRLRYSAAAGSALQAQSARLHIWRADQERQDVLLTALRGIDPARIGFHDDPVRPYDPAADRRTAGPDQHADQFGRAVPRRAGTTTTGPAHHRAEQPASAQSHDLQPSR